MEYDSLPKEWKLQGFDNQFVKEWFEDQPSERKLRICKQMIISKLSKNNAINDRELKIMLIGNKYFYSGEV